jgi:protein TonB
MPEARNRQPVNGSRRVHQVLARAGSPSSSYDDPMTKVFGLDAQGSGIVAWVGYFLGAIALLLGVAVSARALTLFLAMNAPAVAPSAPPQEIDIVHDEPPPPPPPADEKNEPPPSPAPRAVPHEPPPPPAAAQAGKVLTQEPDPNEPVDLTGNTIISGNADSYAGGETASNGTSKSAVRELTSPTGSARGTAAPAPAGPDRARTPSLANGADWSNCPFPPEADTAQIDQAYVTIEISVRADGVPIHAAVLSDPGNGFGRETVRYAMTQRYHPALDRAGNPIAGMLKVRVRFSR